MAGTNCFRFSFAGKAERRKGLPLRNPLPVCPLWRGNGVSALWQLLTYPSTRCQETPQAQPINPPDKVP